MHMFSNVDVHPIYTIERLAFLSVYGVLSLLFLVQVALQLASDGGREAVLKWRDVNTLFLLGGFVWFVLSRGTLFLEASRNG